MSEFPKIMGACRFCGQSRLLETIGELTQEEADERATMECTCSDAKVMQNRQRKIDKANEWAEGYFENMPDVIPLFKEAFRAVANHEVDKISIKRGEWTHSIFLDPDAYLTVKSGKKVEEEESFL